VTTADPGAKPVPLAEPMAEPEDGFVVDAEEWDRRLPGAPSPVRVRVPAKTNLYLEVGDQREDGYHELVTVYQAVSLYDELTAAPAESLSLRITGEGAQSLPVDETNLAMRAVLALAEHTGREPRVRLNVHKGIPVAGGMAGGSADAAAALLACDTLWATGLSRHELAELAAELGSDVPFALFGGTALGTGRGEVLSPVLAPRRLHWVVAVADGGLSTPDVYAELDRLRAEQRPLLAAGPTATLLTALRSDDPAVLGRTLANDLQAAAVSLRPALRRTLEAGEEEGALGAMVSGSGPTCLFLAADADAATGLAARLSGLGVCRTVRAVHGPVPGARVVGG
jgi:4-diphosphocytidyl-2-C-methyl-D-erythritol kinase